MNAFKIAIENITRFHEKQIPTHDFPHAPDSKENECSTFFASKIKAYIFNTSTHHFTSP